MKMVGTTHIGGMVDNDIEAYPGVRIDIRGYAQRIVPKMKTNMVISHAGSDDRFQEATLTTLYTRCYALVILVLEKGPRPMVVMGTLIPTTTETTLWGGPPHVIEMIHVFTSLSNHYILFES